MQHFITSASHHGTFVYNTGPQHNKTQNNTSLPSNTSRIKKNRGFTLTEVAIVLSIIGLILGAVWAASTNVFQELKTSETEKTILTAAQSVRSIYGNSENTGLTKAAVISNAAMFPPNWNFNGIIGTPWQRQPNGNLAYVYGNGTQFSVEVDGMSDAACAALAASFSQAAANSAANTTGTGAVSGLIGFQVATGAVTAGKASIGAIPSGWTTASPTLCNGGVGNKDSISVAFDMSQM